MQLFLHTHNEDRTSKVVIVGAGAVGFHIAGRLGEEDMLSCRQFGSPLEGHPTPAFRYVDAATGSLGQGLFIGVGMAINAKFLDKLPYRAYVLLGDSEMAEGSQWEAIQIAAHYNLENLIGILDVNRLGQRGATMYGHDLEAYGKRIRSFGWETILIFHIGIIRVFSAGAGPQQPLGARALGGKLLKALAVKNFPVNPIRLFGAGDGNPAAQFSGGLGLGTVKVFTE